MKDKITCFKLNWYDCGLCCVEDTVQEEIIVYRNDNLLVFRELNGYGVICSCEIVHAKPDAIETFFAFLEKINDEWQTDYRVEVCDGSEWKVRMWHSSHKVKKICGTVEYPPHGKKIEKYSRSFIEDERSLIDPRLFGCGR